MLYAAACSRRGPLNKHGAVPVALHYSVLHSVRCFTPLPVLLCATRLQECPQSLVRQPSSQRQLHPCFTFGTTSASCTGNILSMLCKISLQAASDHYLRLPQIVSVLFACVSAVCAWFAYDSAAFITWTRCVYSSAL